MPAQMTDDPKGYYARLGLDRDAAPEHVVAAYRRKARLLHPDVPVTGNTQAFVAVNEAYEVLADPLRRAAYDREARELARASARRKPPETPRTQLRPDPPAAQAEPATMRQPRLTDIPIAVWAGVGGLALIATVELVFHVMNLPPPSRLADIRPNAPMVAPGSVTPPPAPVRLPGATNFYVLPAGGPAVVWRLDQPRNAFVPIGALPPFSAVQGLAVVRDKGLVEIRLSTNTAGFVEASRLSPGNAVAAREAFCAYDAGPPPANGEVLARSGSGSGQLTIRNTGSQPAVVKLRGADGIAAATVYLQPGGKTRVNGLPQGLYRPDYAIGELWSRVCNRFAAGMRAQRFTAATDLSALSPLVIPPDLSGSPTVMDIPDQAFER